MCEAPLVHSWPNERYDLATDLYIRHINGRQAWVFRLQAKAVGFPIETLDGHALFEESYDNVAIVGALLRAYQHVVAVENVSTNHTVAFDAQSKGVSAFHKGGVELQCPFTVFHCKNRLAGGDTAKNGDFNHIVQRSGGPAPQTVERGNTP